MKRILILSPVACLGLILAGCAVTGGKQEASRQFTFAPDQGGEVSITRNFAPDGQITNEVTTATNLVAVLERDYSKASAKGLFAMQTVDKFHHQRSGFTGSSSLAGIQKYQSDPDEAAIKEAAAPVTETLRAYLNLKGGAAAALLSNRELTAEDVQAVLKDLPEDAPPEHRTELEALAARLAAPTTPAPAGVEKPVMADSDEERAPAEIEASPEQ